MKTLKFFIVTFVCACLVSTVSYAGDYDGSKPLIFSVKTILECEPNGDSHIVTAEEMKVPNFLIVDCKKMTISPFPPVPGRRDSVIKRMERIDGKLILQGADDGIENVRDGIGWTASISEDTGKAVVTASGDDVGFVIFGACIPR
ncbi:MAG: hypothetical protein L3J18_12065 [Candidatus Brocadia sp.]|uniref:Uncharacterized protein n=1 Tax=Candidatus Brocadia fulgida TaxID=380242 RepID=A0A0M2UQ90_9BACT|nr:MAG: hypothetical protein BROFUL_03063 [Candidatus Brocadia fulgida]MCC6326340.1 hypothetical protein [Candidatus Brocadia sp.]MDG5995341.1 hypothetical protein [Candidatus Brocadia sp.]UJS19634.1 MAG: hypothetical protein L3J18_12065 [Candidatus Brocadia sp.]